MLGHAHDLVAASGYAEGTDRRGSGLLVSVVDAVKRYERETGRVVIVEPVDEAIEHPEAVIAAITNEFEGRFCDVPEAYASGLGPLAYGGLASRWDKGRLQWFLDTTNAPSGPNYANLLTSAFTAWSAAVPFFTFVPAAAASGADIVIRFGGPSLDQRFTGPGGVMASAGYPPSGRISFDMREPWAKATFAPVALHEIGHALGLSHSTNRNSVMYPYANGATTLDAETIDAVRATYGWRSQRRLDDRASSDGPALTTTTHVNFTSSDSRAWMAWKGAGGDNHIWWASSDDGRVWGQQKRIDDARSSHGPALSDWYPGGAFNPSLFLAWKGEGDDQRLFWTRSRGTVEFEAHQRFDDRLSVARPAVAWFDGTIVMAWRGATNERIYWSRFDGRSWTDQEAIAGRMTSHAPALAVLGDRLYMFWQGTGDDDRIFHAFLPKGWGPIWSAGIEVTYVSTDTSGETRHGVRTSAQPVVCSRGDSLTLAFKGRGEDALWHMPLRGGEWSGPAQVPAVLSSSSPGITTLDGGLVMAWRAQAPEQTLHCSRLG